MSPYEVITQTITPFRHNLTDRALRYRANRTPPEGPKICGYCGSRRNVEIEHIDGYEEHAGPENLMWGCRSCNTKKGALFSKLGRGRRTVQFNPRNPGAKSLGQWMLAVLSAKGESDAMTVPAAVEMIRDTPPRRRSQFAQEIWERRRRRGTDRQEVPF